MARYYVNIAGLATDSELGAALEPLAEAIVAEAQARNTAISNLVWNNFNVTVVDGVLELPVLTGNSRIFFTNGGSYFELSEYLPPAPVGTLVQFVHNQPYGETVYTNYYPFIESFDDIQVTIDYGQSITFFRATNGWTPISTPLAVSRLIDLTTAQATDVSTAYDEIHRGIELVSSNPIMSLLDATNISLSRNQSLPLTTIPAGLLKNLFAIKVYADIEIPVITGQAGLMLSMVNTQQSTFPDRVGIFDIIPGDNSYRHQLQTRVSSLRGSYYADKIISILSAGNRVQQPSFIRLAGSYSSPTTWELRLTSNNPSAPSVQINRLKIDLHSPLLN